MHYRQLARLISRHTWLYTEMVVDMTILHSPYTDRCGFVAYITMCRISEGHQALRAHMTMELALLQLLCCFLLCQACLLYLGHSQRRCNTGVSPVGVPSST